MHHIPASARVRLAESPGPPEELEEAIEQRLNQVFVAAIERARGRPLTPVELRALEKRMRKRQYRDAELTEPYAVPFEELAEREGILDYDQLKELELELRTTQPGHAHGYAPSYPCEKPTQAPPGSDLKIRVMRERYLRRQALHHPQDNRIFSPELGMAFLGGRASTPPADDDEE